MSPAALAVTVKDKVAQARKLIAYLISVAVLFTQLDITPTSVKEGIAYGIAVAGALGLYTVPNAKAQAQVDELNKLYEGKHRA